MVAGGVALPSVPGSDLFSNVEALVALIENHDRVKEILAEINAARDAAQAVRDEALAELGRLSEMEKNLSEREEKLRKEEKRIEAREQKFSETKSRCDKIMAQVNEYLEEHCK